MTLTVAAMLTPFGDIQAHVEADFLEVVCVNVDEKELGRDSIGARCKN